MPAAVEIPPPEAAPGHGPAAHARREALERLEAEIVELAGHINAASYRFLELVAAFDRAKGHERHGLTRCAQWLNWQCGIGDNAARERVRIARALASLPRISEAFRHGIVSYSKVRAMTRTATPEDEHVLLNTALYGTAAHVERHVRKYRRCERRDAARGADERQRRRRVSVLHDEHGCVVIHAVLPPETGALVHKALEAAAAELDEAPAAPARECSSNADQVRELARDDGYTVRTRSNVSAGTRVSAEASEAAHEARQTPGYTPFGARRADALVLLAETYLSARAERRGSAADRFQVCVHIDSRLLAGADARARAADADAATANVQASAEPAAEAGVSAGPRAALDAEVLKYCELEGSERPLALATARRLGCDASLVGIVDGPHGEPLSVGRKTRAIPPALARALKIRDGGCRFPGCDHTRFTEGHHIVHWANGGETKLGNLATLCRFHHRLVHEGGYRLTAAGRGTNPELVFTRPDGSAIEANGRYRPKPLARPADGGGFEQPLFELNRERGLEIDARTARCRWGGESMDYSLAIEAQQCCRQRAAGAAL